MKKIAIFTLFPRLALAPFFARAKHRRSRYSIFLYLSTQRRRLLRKLEKTVIKCCIDLKACHTDRKCSQSHHRKPVIYYTVSHPTFPSCAARMSHWLCSPLYFLCVVWNIYARIFCKTDHEIFNFSCLARRVSVAVEGFLTCCLSRKCAKARRPSISASV